MHPLHLTLVTYFITLVNIASIKTIIGYSAKSSVFQLYSSEFSLYMCITMVHIYICTIYMYHTDIKTFLNRPTMRPILTGTFREVVSLGSLNIVTIVLYGRSFGTQIKRSIYGSGGSVRRSSVREACIQQSRYQRNPNTNNYR